MGHERPERQKKVRICIRLDADIVEHFKREAAESIHSEDPIGYQGLIGEALREFLDTREHFQNIHDTGNYMVFDPANWHPVGASGDRSRQS
jgi:hypothetical protein